MQCDLHRAAPVTVLPEINGFAFGGCDPSGPVLELARLVYTKTPAESATTTRTGSAISGATPVETPGASDSRIKSSGGASPTTDSDDPDAGRPCEPFCNMCLLCPPHWGSGGGGGGGGGGDGSDDNNNNGDSDDSNDDDECSTREAEIRSTVCVAGSGCEFDCSTTTGCSVTASATSTVGTPAPAVAITMEQWPKATEESDSDMTSIARSLDSMLSSRYGDLTVLAGYDDSAGPTATTATATSTASTPPDLPTSLSDLQFVIFLRKPWNSRDSWTWAGYLLPTYYDEEYVCNSAYEVVTSTDHIPDESDADSDHAYPISLGPFSAQDLTCGYVSKGLTPGELECGAQERTCLELDALHALGYPGYICGDTEVYLQAWCPFGE
ncbi:hypothetical protein BDV12DRAFT_202724 [Aspergillus spectabilis]